MRYLDGKKRASQLEFHSRINQKQVGSLVMKLEERHLTDLRASGLSDETIKRSGIYSARCDEIAALVAVKAKWLNSDGYLIPYYSLNKEIIQYRPRLDDAPLGNNGRPCRYLTKTGATNRLYFPPDIILKKEILQDKNVPLVITEGEKKALKASQEGLNCVALPGVYGFLTKENNESKPIPDLDLIKWKKRDIFIVYDSDLKENIQVRRAQVALKEELQSRGANVEVIDLPSGINGENVGLDDFLLTHSVSDLFKFVRKKQSALWPRLPGDAYHGVIGEIIKKIAPETEADPAAILIQLLICLGNMIKFVKSVGPSSECREPYLMIEADKHSTNLFGVLVARTGEGRKGTSLGIVKWILNQIDEYYLKDCEKTGLSSGEGLIWAIRDEIKRKDEVVDSGVSDKRLMVFQQEFAEIFKVISRDGNTLSPIIRNAWDRNRLAILTKNNTATANENHISIIGHITREELQKLLRNTEVCNGFANRFLWLCSKRARSLPFGGKYRDDTALKLLIGNLKDAFEWLRENAGKMEFSLEAKDLWISLYDDLTKPHAGVYGALIARGSAQVIRLSMVYACFDKSSIILPEHIRAALAVWRYCTESTNYIFGSLFGDRVADDILAALSENEDGLTKTGIHALFNKNKSALDINRALEVLKEAGKVYCIKEKQRKKPKEWWFYSHTYEFNEFNNGEGNKFVKFVPSERVSPNKDEILGTVQTGVNLRGETITGKIVNVKGSQ